MNSSKKGFTIAELIVVIMILSILATLGFVSFSGYSSGVRDANRISQITGISNSLGVYNIKNFLPLPDNYILIEVNGEDIAYQGFAGQELLEEIDYKKGGKDPKDEQYYTYYITKSRKDFQLLAFLSKDNDVSSINVLNNTYGAGIDYANRIPFVEGKRLGVLIEPITNRPIQEIDSLQAVKKLDLGLTLNNYIAILKNDDLIEGDNTVLADLEIASISGGKGCTGKSGAIVCDWSSNEIPNITIVGDDTVGRKWSDLVLATYCNDYRNPTSGYEYSGDVGDGVYWIDPAINGTGFKVFCDMTNDGGGWTYTTMLSDTVTKNLFYTGNSNKITSITSGISTKGRISDIWLDNEKKDIMLICETNSTNHINYETPFFIYGFQKVDIGNLTKQNKVDAPPGPSGSIGYGTSHLTMTLNGKWNGNTFALDTNFGNSSLRESHYLSKLGVTGEGGYLFMLRGSMEMALYPAAAVEGPSRRSPYSIRSLNNSNYCMTAIR